MVRSILSDGEAVLGNCLIVGLALRLELKLERHCLAAIGLAVKASSTMTDDNDNMDDEGDLEEQAEAQISTCTWLPIHGAEDLQLNGTKTSRCSENRPIDEIVVLE